MFQALRSRLGHGTTSAAVISFLNGASKVLGLARELLLAWAFGTSAVVDAFRIGMSLTTYFSHMFFGEAMTGVMVPLLVRGDQHRDTQVKAGVAAAALAVTAPIGLAFLIFPGIVLGLFTPDLSLQQRAWAIAFLRVFGIAVPLYSLSSIAVMVHQARGNFFPLGIRPVGQNAFVIAGTLAAVGLHAPIALPLSFAAYFAVLLTVIDRGQLVSAISTGVSAVLQGLRLIIGRWLPLALGLLLLRSNTIVERYFGSRLETGAIAALDYARTVTDLPVLLLAIPTGAVLLTSLSREDDAGLTPSRRRKLMLLLVLLVAWSAFAIALARPLTVLIFRRGAFAAESVTVTSTALSGLGVGAWAVALGYVLVQYLMATTSPWRLVIPAALSVVSNIALAVQLVPKLGLLGLALSSSGGAVAFVAAGMAVALSTPRPAA